MQEERSAMKLPHRALFLMRAFGMGAEEPIITADDARRWVRDIASDGLPVLSSLVPPPAGDCRCT